MDQDQEVKDARAKLAARFGQTQIGGKGAYLKCILAALPGNIFSFLSSLPSKIERVRMSKSVKFVKE